MKTQIETQRYSNESKNCALWRTLFLVTALGVTSLAAESAPAIELSREAGEVSKASSALNLAQEFIKDKDWKLGLNKRADGTRFFVAIGSGDIGAPVDNPQYIVSRSNAYTKAMLTAWGDTRRFVAQEVSASATSFYAENIDGLSPAEAGIEDKSKTLITGALEAELQKKGLDPKSAPQSDKDKIISSETFKMQMGSAAAGKVMGVQSLTCFEGRGEGQGYQIVVVSVWSDKLQQLAEALLTGTKLPDGPKGKPLTSWIPPDEQLISSFGVQLVQDENGQPAVLAYGQSSPVSESSRSISAAHDKARLEALASLRFFVGAMVKVADDQEKSESIKEFSDKTKSYEASNTFQQSMEIYAPAQKFSGVSPCRRWSSKHPVSGQTVAGIVLSWTPESGLFAAHMGKSMEKPKTQTESNSSETKANPSSRRALKDYDSGASNQGAVGSDNF